jgi:hypothetical protein
MPHHRHVAERGAERRVGRSEERHDRRAERRREMRDAGVARDQGGNLREDGGQQIGAVASDEARHADLPHHVIGGGYVRRRAQ